MSEKWQQHPFRVGIIAGFLGLPLLWTVQESVLRLATQTVGLLPRQIFVLFMLGALPGAVLGAGLFKARAEHHKGNRRAVKWTLLCHGGTIVAFTLLLIYLFAFVGFISPPRFVFGLRLPPWIAIYCGPMLTRNFPFHCAVLMFCCGLFMRSRH